MRTRSFWLVLTGSCGFLRKACSSARRKIIAVSDFTKWELTTYYKIPPSKIRVIHNGVDINKFQPAVDKRRVKVELGFNPDDIAIVSVGRLYARKGLFTLIESMPAVVKRFPNAKFIISGKGQSDEMRKLVIHAQKLGVKANIVFTGYYPDKKLPKLYQAADVFAFSTFYEHHPFAVLGGYGNWFACCDNHCGWHPRNYRQRQERFFG